MKMEFWFSSPWGERKCGAKAISDYAIMPKGLDPFEPRLGAPVKHDNVGLAISFTYEDEITTFVSGIEDIRILRGLGGVQDHGTANFVEQPGAFENARVFFKHLKKRFCKD